ncbi:MAG: pyrroline-5-carboxylate reductase [Dehalococcoidales bacterium]|nr:MAG: pyrroline-5-carboxylate reductase [Dehalococcoidales bacterium]
MKIAFIGGGNMGEAMLSALLDKRISSSQDVVVSDTAESRRQHIKQKYGVGVTADNQLAISKTNVIVLAVKPQNLPDVITQLGGQLNPGQLLLSIIAGARLDTICTGLKHLPAVRAMPNTPAQIGQGITVWTATEEVNEQQKQWARAILGAIGQEIYVEKESDIDMATAVSGSGPAYFFLFVEALSNAAVEIGLSRDVAEKLVLQTILGSGHLIQQSGKSPADLRRMVTSPGGTTAEAISELEKGQFTDLIARAVQAAYNKARELGDSNPRL